MFQKGKKSMPSNKQLNTTVFMEDHHVVKDVGYSITTKKADSQRPNLWLPAGEIRQVSEAKTIGCKKGSRMYCINTTWGIEPVFCNNKM